MKNKLTEEDIDAIQAQCSEQVWELYGFALKERFGRGDA